MLSDWIHWLSSKRPDELLLLMLPWLLLDTPRYGLGSIAVCFGDAFKSALPRNLRNDNKRYHRPLVCAILAGLNEAETVGATLESVLNSYPNLEVIVVDDGSTDGMSNVARQIAIAHENVIVLRKPHRGGKSSALNFALPFTKAEIIVCVDTDSHLEPTAIWEIVQPFTDPAVGAVAGTVLARNGNVNLVTSLQCSEYLHSIFVGRMIASHLGILSIVSGAFGAFRREALERAQGWDVGPGEDGDLVLRLRKAGWKVVHAPYAQCLTNLPTSWGQLFRQRRRWEWATITLDCRKHIDMANVFSPNFRLANFAVLAETWLFSIALTIAYFGYLLWLCVADTEALIFVLLTSYAAYMVLELLKWIVVLYFSPNRRRDICTSWCAPLLPAYYFYLKCATLVAILEETFYRRSSDDGFVPERVRRVTWRW